MLKYLINFGVDVEDSTSISMNNTIDITDVEKLEAQINEVRKAHYSLLKLYDNLQEEYMTLKSKLSRKIREINTDNATRTERQDAMSLDIEYLDIVDTIEALKEAMRTVNNQIDFAKSDLRILQSSMYRKY